ncbi:uncharacterized protein [Atheta coriaria]|uniref:uncharacterized protein n=1 Tax=Dalotia coriaria TaxID=877792 RepID=UPI0031F3DA4B
MNSAPAKATMSVQDPRLYSSNYYNTAAIMVPNVPPPPIVPFRYDLSLPPPIQLDAKTDDELFVETWLSKIGKINLNLESTTVEVKTTQIKPQKSKGHVSIHAAKQGLKKCLEITQRLEATQKILEENMSTMSTDEWKRHTSVIGSLKDELTVLMAQYQNPETLKTLKYELAQRAKKRATQKRRRYENQLQMAKKKEENLAQHKKIDSWLVAKKEEAERAKAEEIMKKDADCVLAEVTKKKTEARKQLSLVASLIKLRNVRETAAKARGEKIPAEDNAAFCKTTEALIKMWENSSKTYSIEEQGLKLMLERNASEDNKQTIANKEKEVAQQWDQVLFGPSYVPSPLYWALTSAKHDMEKFIAIRKSWDTFLTPNTDTGSKIPLGWVLPADSPSLEWSQYQHS